MLERLLIAGAGGQGIILIGRILASVAVKKNIPHVTFFPAYGAEVRGGTSNCQVILSSEEIASPVSEQLDSMIIMNQPSLDEFLPKITKNCLIIINSSMCEVPASPPTLAVNATELADQLGNIRVANFVMLGVYLAAKQIVSAKEIEECIQEILAGKNQTLIDLNIKALHAGLTQIFHTKHSERHYRG